LIPIDSGRGAATDPCPLGDLTADGPAQPTATLALRGESGTDGPPRQDRLEEIVKQIGSHRQRMLRAARTAVEEHIRIGQLLNHAKELCKHGHWARFLAKCHLNQSTANQG
jgi:hypothetical protein